jgi:hypothetical protein
MAGLVAAARARELGADTVVLEKGNRAGGSMLLSSGVVWRYVDFDEFRRECPAGEPVLQRLVWERLDDALAWLEQLGAPVVQEDTENPLTTGRRFDTRGLTDALVRAAGEVRLGEPVTNDQEGPLVLATGGFQGDRELVAQHVAPAAPLPLRANPWSAGDGLRLGLARGAGLSAGMDEFYGRNMPAREWPPEDFVRLAQLYGGRALVLDELGEPFFTGEVSWSETDLVQATARRPGASAWYVLDEEALDTMRPLVEAACTAVAAVELPFPVPEDAVVGVHVRAAITHTIGGLRIDERARVAGADGLWAAGVDAGGISTGGYASGLAQALVLGLVAAENATQ